MASWNPSRLLELLKQYWGYTSFRPLQQEIIQAIIEGNDVLAILPTGGGKSLCYQLPTLYFQKLTVVISPLIALMEDQVVQLQKRNIPAVFLNSTLSFSQVQEYMSQLREGAYLFLYCAPERLRSEAFVEFLSCLNIGLFAIDEAHCISQWGHQFRPDYRKLHLLRDLFSSIPIIALTASAIPEVKKDIIQQLRLRNPRVFQGSVVRSNLQYRVTFAENRLSFAEKALEQLKEGSAIVYVRSRKGTHLVAEHLKRRGYSCEAYHAGLSAQKRKQLQEVWLTNAIQTIVATNAFGMGIDKSDVRLVLHLDLPPDLESYYQEAGRAGRDQKEAYAILLYHPSFGSKALQQWEQAYPPFHKVEYCFQWLYRYFQIPPRQHPLGFFPIELSEWTRKFGMSAVEILSCLKILHEQKRIYLELEPDKHHCFVQILVTPEQLREYARTIPTTIPLITALLREFGGALYQFGGTFNPYALAKKYQFLPHQLFALLNKLAVDRIIEYRPPLARESFRFLTPYHPLSLRELNWEYYQFLREQAKKRLDTMIHYAENKRDCRQILIAHYFGEEKVTPCGQCDNCIRTKTSSSLFKKWVHFFKS